MLDYSYEDIVALLDLCPNLNSAIKGFIKQDSGGDQQAVKFAKALRKAAQSKRGISEFVEKYHNDYAPHFLAVARQGHTEVINLIAEQVISEYADRFNETYEKEGEGIKVNNREEFDSITREVKGLLGKALTDAGLPENGFIKSVIIDWLYDPEVIPEVVPIFVEAA